MNKFYEKARLHFGQRIDFFIRKGDADYIHGSGEIIEALNLPNRGESAYLVRPDGEVITRELVPVLQDMVRAFSPIEGTMPILAREVSRAYDLPHNVTKLHPGHVFVFGSNMDGEHAGGAARHAAVHFGAETGVHLGPTGRSFAIPTLDSAGGSQLPLSLIELFVAEMIRHAKTYDTTVFFVTEIGCGIAGFKVEQIAPLFRGALNLSNVALPERFVKFLKDNP